MKERGTELRQLTTFGIDVKADRVVEATGVEDLITLFNNEPDAHILGGGSNVLLNGDVSGTVVLMRIVGRTVVREDDQHIWIRFGAGETWHDIVSWSVDQGWGGLENLALIPGTVGAAPMQNIGAYGVEQNAIFDSLTAIDRTTLSSPNHKTLSLQDRTAFIEAPFDAPSCEFGYRDSIFKHALRDKSIITSVTYKLSKQPVVNTSYADVRYELEAMNIDAPTIRDVRDAVVRVRTRKLPDPRVIGNAGSFFKNPIVSAEAHAALKTNIADIPSYPQRDGTFKLAAAWLIDQCGWKGYRKGSAGVHPNQALVLVNYGAATGAEILELAYDIQASVLEKFNVDLEREVNVW